MKGARFILIAIGVAAGLGWGFQRARRARLEAELDSRHRQARELTRLSREHDRLQKLQATPGELARLREEAAAPQPIPSPVPFPAAPAPGAMTPGAWIAAGDWRNCGRATPTATVETLLWASASGDVAALKTTLHFDDTARAQAAATLARLPESERAQYGTPEDLLAMLITANVPLDRAMMVASQQFNDRDAVEYVRLQNTDGATRQVVLSLFHGDDGWKLRIPDAAIKQLLLAKR